MRSHMDQLTTTELELRYNPDVSKSKLRMYHILQDGRQEKSDRVACCNASQIHETGTIYLPIFHNPNESLESEMIHVRVRGVDFDPSKKHCPLFLGQKSAVFREVANSPFGSNRRDRGDETFDTVC